MVNLTPVQKVQNILHSCTSGLLHVQSFDSLHLSMHCMGGLLYMHTGSKCEVSARKRTLLTIDGEFNLISPITCG